MKNIHRLKQDPTAIAQFERAIDKIEHWFFSYPTQEFSLNELIKALNISKTSANQAVNQLVEQGLISFKTIGRLWRIKAEATNENFIKRKIPSNLYYVYRTGIIDYVAQHFPQARCVVLFGSVRKGDDIETSDIDIALEVAQETQLQIYDLVLDHFGYRENVPVKIHLFSRKNIDIHLFANIANGIVLSGFLEVKP